MCGIAGIVSLANEMSSSYIVKMSSIIEHRGPDGYGYFSHNLKTDVSSSFKSHSDNPAHIILGHRRLAILDLSESGHQPMSYMQGKYWITFNGEVYNYIELKEQLQGKGYTFNSETDTEVILAAYSEWGEECLKYFNGMWAFAILDLHRKKLFCARDRLGIKPFYYNISQNRFSFGSEIKQLITLPWVTAEINKGILFDFFTFGSYGFDRESTFIAGIKELPGGQSISIDLRKSKIDVQVKSWWDIDLKNKISGLSDEEYAAEYYKILEDAVRLRLRSDVPVGSCLSGGLDSSGIVCIVDKLLSTKKGTIQKTFTAVSEIEQFNEREFADIIINSTKVEPHFILPDPKNLFKELDNIIWHQDEPFISTSIFAGWCVYRLVKSNNVTVSLDGQGPDEMLAGYLPYMYSTFLLDQVVGGNFRSLVQNWQDAKEISGSKSKDLVLKIIKEFLRGKLPKGLQSSIQFSRNVFTKDFFEDAITKSSYLKGVEKLSSWRREVGGSYLDQELYYATRYGSLRKILHYVDSNSMAFSVESRLPFLDYRLVEYSFTLPLSQKVDRGFAKVVYRNAMKGVLPEAVRQRKSKLGFATAEPDWLKGAAADIFKNTFEGLKKNEIFNGTEILNSFESFQKGHTPFNPVFWKVFCTTQWKRQLQKGN
jgi:asparagine synthase (glutamine-hydrolysing)